MTARPRRTSPVWSDVKGKLAAFDRAGLVGLVQDLYAASEANRTFLHAQFGLGADLLAPYKCDDRTLALAQCSQEPGCVGIRRQEGHLGFQKGRRPTRGTGGADGVLLRTRSVLRHRIWHG